MKQNLSLGKCSLVQAVIFDWAGTLMDFGCMAPVVMLIDVFKQAGVSLSLAEARKSMGLPEPLHIQKLLEMDSVRTRWEKKWARAPTEQDGEALLNNLITLQLESLSHYTSLVPGALEMIERLRRRNIKVGSTASYQKGVTEVYLKAAAAQGFVPDLSLVTSAPSKQGRASYLFLQNANEVNVERLHACVKVDDTLLGIQEGLQAGMWTIGVAASGNEMGLALEQYLSLLPALQEEKRQAAAERFYQAGAHYVVPTITDILPCLLDIEKRLRRGELPSQVLPASQVA